MEIKTEYKGHEIFYKLDAWQYEGDLGKKSFCLLSDMETWIDKRNVYLKKKMFKHFDVIAPDGYSDKYDKEDHLFIGEATSINDNNTHVNITFENGRRSFNRKCLVLLTEEKKEKLLLARKLKVAAKKSWDAAMAEIYEIRSCIMGAKN